MNRILLAYLRHAMSCPLHQSLGRASALSACKGAYQFSGGKCLSEGINVTTAGWLNPSQLSAAGGAG